MLLNRGLSGCSDGAILIFLKLLTLNLIAERGLAYLHSVGDSHVIPRCILAGYRDRHILDR